MKLYAKKADDVWYKGTLVDIMNLQRSLSEVHITHSLVDQWTFNFDSFDSFRSDLKTFLFLLY